MSHKSKQTRNPELQHQVLASSIAANSIQAESYFKLYSGQKSHSYQLRSPYILCHPWNCITTLTGPSWHTLRHNLETSNVHKLISSITRSAQNKRKKTITTTKLFPSHTSAYHTSERESSRGWPASASSEFSFIEYRSGTIKRCAAAADRPRCKLSRAVLFPRTALSLSLSLPICNNRTCHSGLLLALHYAGFLCCRSD